MLQHLFFSFIHSFKSFKSIELSNSLLHVYSIKNSRENSFNIITLKSLNFFNNILIVLLLKVHYHFKVNNLS